MKKIVILLALFAIPLFAQAKTEIKIPYEFLNDLTKNVEIKADSNYLKNILIKQLVRNYSIDGTKVKDFTTDTLMEYLDSDKLFKKTGSNKLKEPITGSELEIVTDESCKKDDACYIKVSLPDVCNQDCEAKGFSYTIKIKRDEEKGLDLTFPDI